MRASARPAAALPLCRSTAILLPCRAAWFFFCLRRSVLPALLHGMPTAGHPSAHKPDSKERLAQVLLSPLTILRLRDAARISVRVSVKESTVRDSQRVWWVQWVHINGLYIYALLLSYTNYTTAQYTQ